MSLELNDSFHIILRSGCLMNFVSEEKITVLKVFVKCESLGGCRKLSVCVSGYLFAV